MFKVLSIIGTRPEAIKMAPVVKELERYPNRIVSRVLVTAQHRQMLDQVLDLFHIEPDYDLDLMRQAQSLNGVAAAVLAGLEPILRDERPDWVLVQGDTTTAMASSIAAAHTGVKVGHVEAGLRTHDKTQPFPEELNRRIAGVVADLHFAPTEWARRNLLRENVPAETVVVTGNPVIDALHMASALPYPYPQGLLRDIPWHKRIVMVTAHRRENFGAPLESICAALHTLARRYGDDLHIVYPVHLNPNVVEPVRRLLGDTPGITLLPPLDYLPLVHLLKRSHLVLTDSGGLQEEAPSLGKPVLIMRETTERPEVLEAGTGRLVGTDKYTIVSEVSRLLDDAHAYRAMAHAANPYGDGRAARRIVAALDRASTAFEAPAQREDWVKDVVRLPDAVGSGV